MTDAAAPRATPPGLPPGVARALAVPAVLVLLAVGLWFFAGVVAPGYTSSIVLGALWFVAVGVALGRVGRRWPGLKLAVRATFLAAAIATAIAFYWTSFRDDVVDERIVTGVAASQAPAERAGAGAAPGGARVNVTEATGAFETLAHSSRGTASVVRVPGGERFLTFSDFRTDNGPDLRVYLVAGPVNGDGDVEDVVDLGALKGNVGNQQYAIPPGTDLARYSTVVVWCRAFTVSFAKAELAAA